MPWPKSVSHFLRLESMMEPNSGKRALSHLLQRAKRGVSEGAMGAAYDAQASRLAREKALQATRERCKSVQAKEFLEEQAKVGKLLLHEQIHATRQERALALG